MIRIYEETDMERYKREMEEYKLAMQQYNDEMAAYNDSYSSWYGGTREAQLKRVQRDLREQLEEMGRKFRDSVNSNYPMVDEYFSAVIVGTDSFVWSEYETKEPRVRTRIWVGADKEVVGIPTLDELFQEFSEQVDTFVQNFLAERNIQILDTDVDDRENIYDVTWKIKYPTRIHDVNYRISEFTSKNSVKRPTKPKKPEKPQKPVRVKPEKIGPVNGIYTTKMNYTYADEEELWDLLSGFGYKVDNNDAEFERIQSEMEAAGWIKRGKIIIPKGTKFSVDGSDSYYDYIKIENGPLSGMTFGFLGNDPYGDGLSLDYFIKRYTE